MASNVMETFQRDISYRVNMQEDRSMVLTATLHDLFHDIVMDITLAPGSLLITAASVTFHRSPTADCCNVSGRLDTLVGFTIGRGLNAKLQAALGGGEGCGNLRTMLQALLPLAINVRASEGIVDQQEMLDSIHDQLLGTCAGYARPR